MRKKSKLFIAMLALVVLISAITLTSCKEEPVKFSEMLGVDLEKDQIIRVEFSRKMGNGETYKRIDLSSIDTKEILSKLDNITFTKYKNKKDVENKSSILRIRFFLEMKPLKSELEKQKKDKNYDAQKELLDKEILTDKELSNCKYIEYNYDLGFKKFNKPHSKTKEGYYKASTSLDEILKKFERS